MYSVCLHILLYVYRCARRFSDRGNWWPLQRQRIRVVGAWSHWEHLRHCTWESAEQHGRTYMRTNVIEDVRFSVIIGDTTLLITKSHAESIDVCWTYIISSYHMLLNLSLNLYHSTKLSSWISKYFHIQAKFFVYYSSIKTIAKMKHQTITKNNLVRNLIKFLNLDRRVHGLVQDHTITFYLLSVSTITDRSHLSLNLIHIDSFQHLSLTYKLFLI